MPEVRYPFSACDQHFRYCFGRKTSILTVKFAHWAVKDYMINLKSMRVLSRLTG